MNSYKLSCDCGTVKLTVNGTPRVRGTCHCGDCRDLLQIPYHMVNAWMPDQLVITSGADNLEWYQHPRLNMKRVYCRTCGETLFNTNAAEWCVISQNLVAKVMGDVPEELTSQSHFFYDRRIVDIADELPKK